MNKNKLTQIGKFFFIVLVSLSFGNISHSQLVSNGKTKYVLSATNNSSTQGDKAVSTFKKYFQKSTGINLAIVKTKTSLPIISIGKSIDQRIPASELAKVRDDGFIIYFAPQYIGIAGKTERGTLNGVYSFIEKYLKVYYLAPNTYNKFKQLTSITVPVKGTFVSNPAFYWRDIFSEIGYDDLYSEWHALRHMYKEPNIWGNTDHTFFKLMPPEKYLKTNPEFYSLINDKRIASQLCLSNGELLKVLMSNLKALIAQKPEKPNWMVGQEDVGRFCECDKCKSLYKKYGGYSGALVFFVNSVAKEFPKKTIGTFAYHETLTPPTNIKPVSNVLIVYAPIEAFHQNAYINNTEKKYVNNLEGWSTISKNLMVWDYVANYNSMLNPFPIFEGFQPNFQLFQKVGVKYVYAEGIMKKGEHFKELKTYLISKLLWNPQFNADSIINSFCEQFYGPAKPYVLKYLNALNSNVKANRDNLRFWGGSEKYLALKNLLQYEQILDDASAIVKNDNIYKERVDDVRLAIDFLVELNYQKAKKNIQKTNNKDEDARRIRILETAKRTGIDWIIHNGKWKRIIDYFK